MAAIAVGAGLTAKPFASLDALVALVAACFILIGAGELAAWVVAGIGLLLGGLPT